MIVLKKPQFIFIALVGVILTYVGIWEILNLSPQSIHRWRQTDSASIAFHYFQYNMSFFEPEILNQRSDQGLSGNAVSEFPGYYYLIALCWKVVGYSNFIYRLICLLFALSGVYFLFTLSKNVLHSYFWSFYIGMLLFSSCIFLYYGSNFLVDIPAFSSVVIGIYFLIQRKNKTNYLFVAFLCITFAGLTKIVTLIPFIAILAAYIFTHFHIMKWKVLSNRHYFLLVLMFLLIGSWFYYAQWYNSAHQTDFFSTQTFPIWSYNWEEIKHIWKDGILYWINDYFNVSFRIVLTLQVVYCLIKFKELDLFWRWLFVFMTLGLLSFVSLWYYCFLQHDYYFVHTFFYILFLQILFIKIVKQKKDGFFNSNYWKALLIILVLLNINNARYLVGKRYKEWAEGYPIFQDSPSIQKYLQNIGVNKEDKILALGEGTPNYLLYTFGRKGWTEWVYGYGKQLNKKVIDRRIQLNAKYLILAYPTNLSDSVLSMYTKNKIGQFKDVRIFKLENVR